MDRQQTYLQSFALIMKQKRIIFLPDRQSAAVLAFFSSFIILSDLSFSSRLAPQQRAASTTLVQCQTRRLSLGIGFLLTNSTHNSLNDVCLYAALFTSLSLHSLCRQNSDSSHEAWRNFQIFPELCPKSVNYVSSVHTYGYVDFIFFGTRTDAFLNTYP